MKVGLIDVDSHNYPNLPLMKLSAHHKNNGDLVEWYEPMKGIYKSYDIVYMSKVFSFSLDYGYPIFADKIVKGGSGYCIKTNKGKEYYHSEYDSVLPYEVEHIYPDYSLYPDKTKDTAYGFLTRGCPRGCDFCHVKDKEGIYTYQVADLSEFWKGQKNIELLDPNILACSGWKNLMQQLIDSKAYVNFNQGLDIRLMTDEKAEIVKKIKVKNIHFAWDKYEDKDTIIPKFKMFKELTGWHYKKMTVYVLVNFNTTIQQDLERVYTLRDLGYNPYIMIYAKEHTKKGDTIRHMQRWVNNRLIFRSCDRFENYKNI